MQRACACTCTSAQCVCTCTCVLVYIYSYTHTTCVRLHRPTFFFPTVVFKFSLINYHTFAEVPLRLILAIATAFDERREVCRQCFYGERSLSYNEGGVCCEAQHVWDNPITVIPGEFPIHVDVDVCLGVHALF